MTISLRLPTADAAHKLWRDALPFPNLIVPDALWPDEAAAAAAEYPPPDSGGWHTFGGELEAGKQEGRAEIAGPTVAAIHDHLASPEFVGWLATVTGIPDLVADPDRTGGGIHQSGPGARLGMHVDYRVTTSLPGYVRAVNVIVFVGTHDRWADAWGGWLRLGVGVDQLKVAPLPGTFVAFDSSDDGWHGHPDPMAPGAPLRRSVPTYYFRPIRDGETIDVHSTRFLG